MKNKYITIVEKLQIKNNIPKFNTGDSVCINIWVQEGNKKRIQIFKGFIIAIKNRGINSAFIVRKISYGEGVERTFQTHSPIIESIKIEKRAKVRQSKIYYIRKLTGKASRIKEKV